MKSIERNRDRELGLEYDAGLMKFDQATVDYIIDLYARDNLSTSLEGLYGFGLTEEEAFEDLVTNAKKIIDKTIFTLIKLDDI